MEGAAHQNKPWWHKFFDWCLYPPPPLLSSPLLFSPLLTVVHPLPAASTTRRCVVERPQMFCEGTATYDFASSYQSAATTTVVSGGQEHEPGRGATFQDIARDGWAGWAWQSQGYFYQGDVAGWLGRPALLTLPVFSPSRGLSGAVRSQWSLLESALPAQFRGPQVLIAVHPLPLAPHSGSPPPHSGFRGPQEDSVWQTTGVRGAPLDGLLSGAQLRHGARAQDRRRGRRGDRGGCTGASSR